MPENSVVGLHKFHCIWFLSLQIANTLTNNVFSGGLMPLFRHTNKQGRGLTVVYSTTFHWYILWQTSAADTEVVKQGYVAPRLKSSLQQLYGHHHALVYHYRIFSSQMAVDLLSFTYIFYFSYHRQDFQKFYYE